MSELFGRSYRLTVGDISIDNLSAESLRITFEIERQKAGLGAPNSAEIAVYGFSRETRDRLSALAAGGWVNQVPSVAAKRAKNKELPPGISVRLEAGWNGEVEQIFLGALRNVASERVGSDWITTFGAADGEKEIKLAKVRRSFAKGTPTSAVLTALASALGIKSGNAAAVFPQLKMGAAEVFALQQPLHVVGSAAEELDYFVRSCGCEWSIQDGALQIMLAGSVADAPGASSPVLSKDSGLIGQAKVDSGGTVSGRALLCASLIPGRSFRIESAAITDNFRCIKTTHRGDSHSTSGVEGWIVEFEGDPL